MMRFVAEMTPGDTVVTFDRDRRLYLLRWWVHGNYLTRGETFSSPL